MKNNYFSKKLIILLSILSSNLIASIAGGGAGAEVNHYFLPQDKERIKYVLDETFFGLDGIAPRKFKLASYWLTDPSFVDKLIDLKRRGTDVQVIYDSSSPDHDSTIMDRLLNGNIEPVLTPAQDSDAFMPRSGRSMHNKSMVVDDMVFTGSANYTEAGFGVNDETVMVINSPVMARQFEANFDAIQNRTFDDYIGHIANKSSSSSFRSLVDRLYTKNETFKKKWNLKSINKHDSISHFQAYALLPKNDLSNGTRFMTAPQRKFLQDRGIGTINMYSSKAFKKIAEIKSSELLAKK